MTGPGTDRELYLPPLLALACVFLLVATWGHPKLSGVMARTAWFLEIPERPAAFLSERFQQGLGWIADRDELLTRISQLEDRSNRLVFAHALEQRERALAEAAAGNQYPVDYRDPKAWWEEVRVDLGSGTAPMRGTPALKEGALAGVVTETWAHGCWITLVTGENSYLPVVVEPTRDLGVLVGDGRGGLWLRYTPPLDLPTGTRIVTAFGGDKMVPGLWVGGLNGEKRQTEPGLTEYGVTPAVDLSRLHSLSLPEARQ